MPEYVVNRVAEALNQERKPLNGSRICILGVAYKKNVDDPREAPAFTIMELLQRRGAVVSYNDPHIPSLPMMRHHHIQLQSQDLTEEFLAALDCAIIVTDHDGYDFARIARCTSLLVDTRNATAGIASGNCRIVKA